MGTKVIIRAAGFGYRTSDMKEGTPHLVATRGQELDVSKLDAESKARGEKYGAWGEPTEQVEAPDSTGADLEPAPFTSVGDLSAWLAKHQPNAGDTVKLVGPEDGPDAAKRAQLLLDAEADATGGKPRKSVREPLEAILDAQDGGEAKAQQAAADAAKAKAEADAKA